MTTTSDFTSHTLFAVDQSWDFAAELPRDHYSPVSAFTFWFLTLIVIPNPADQCNGLVNFICTTSIIFSSNPASQ
jgi:hypothetical protein